MAAGMGGPDVVYILVKTFIFFPLLDKMFILVWNLLFVCAISLLGARLQRKKLMFSLSGMMFSTEFAMTSLRCSTQ